MNTTCNNPSMLESDHADAAIVHESTYAMLVRSEEKERTVLESVVYFLVVLSAITAILQFAQQPIALPLDSVRTIATADQVSRLVTVCSESVRC